MINKILYSALALFVLSSLALVALPLPVSGTAQAQDLVNPQNEVTLYVDDDAEPDGSVSAYDGDVTIQTLGNLTSYDEGDAIEFLTGNAARFVTRIVSISYDPDSDTTTIVMEWGNQNISTEDAFNLVDLDAPASSDPFCFIQSAIITASGTTIEVGPGTYDEFLDVNKSLTLVSSDGAEVTTIYPTTPPPEVPKSVVSIHASNVVFDGFMVKIDGYLDQNTFCPDTAIAAWNPQEGYENLQILNNIVMVDDVDTGFGIAVYGYGGNVLIDNNMVSMIAKYNAEGIHIEGCSGDVLISQNDVSVMAQYGPGDYWPGCIHVRSFNVVKILNNTVYTEVVEPEIGPLQEPQFIWPCGIFIQNGYKAQVAGNTVEIEASGQDIQVNGIFAQGVQRTEIGNPSNEVTIELTASAQANAFGMWINGGEACNVLDNSVTITANGTWTNNTDIDLGNIGEATVLNNSVQVTANSTWTRTTGINAFGIGQIEIGNNQVNLIGNSTFAEVPSPGPVAVPQGIEVEQRKAEISAEILKATLGITLGDANSGAQAWGIWASGGQASIHGNGVGVTAQSVSTAEQEESANAYGRAESYGIQVDGPQYAVLSQNTVEAVAEVSPSAEESGSGNANVYGESFAYGITLNGIQMAIVDGNSVTADSEAVVTAAASDVTVTGEESALSRLQSLLDRSDEIVGDALEKVSDASGSEQQPLSWASGGSYTEAIGILSQNVGGYLEISNNETVSGTARVTANLSATPQPNPQDPGSGGGATAVGYGMLLLGNPYAHVINNGLENGVSGTGMVQAEVDVQEALTEWSSAGYNSSAYGIGISSDVRAQDLPIGQQDSNDYINIANNEVAADGSAKTTVTSIENVVNQDAWAGGWSYGVGIGIVTQGNNPVIQENAVQADADAAADIAAQSLSTQDPNASGNAGGMAFGILAFNGLEGGQILNNEVTANAKATNDTKAALVQQLPQDAWAGYSGSQGVGAGIALLNCQGFSVLGNDGRGSGDAAVDVIADSSVPLDRANAYGEAYGFGLGLILDYDVGATEARRNTFDGTATASAEATAGATFKDEWAWGYKFAIDVMFGNPSTVPGECFPVNRVNYNNIGGGSQALQDNSYIIEFDYGLLNNTNCYQNALYNWWGDPSGPSGMGHGTGAAIWSWGGWVPYEPWLSHPIEDLIKDQVGYYGFQQGVVQGWNTLSTSFALENPLWGSIASLGDGLDWSIAYRYDPTQAMPWVQITSTNFSLYPLEGIYLKMNSDDEVFLLSSPSTYAPLRNLTKGQSWYLIGPTPYGEDFPFTSGMGVDIALISIEEIPNGDTGYVQVVSPAVGGQTPWIYVPGMEPKPMIRGKGYWVFMENPDTLAGFVFTPLPIPMPTGD